MKTLWIADMMADYIISHKGEEYKIDLWLWVFIDFWWTDGKLRLKHYDEEWTFMESLPLGWELTEKEVKELLLDRMWVYEDNIDEIKLD